jgi:PEP-CTERM motif
MSRRVLRLGTIAVSVILFAIRAQAAPIHFEAFADGDVLTNEIPGLTIANGEVLTAGIGLNDFEFPPLSGTNVLANMLDPITLTPLSISIAFASPVGRFSGYFTYDAPLSIAAFDSGGVLLGTVLSAFGSNLALSGDAGSTPNEFLLAMFAGISSVQITGGNFVVDNAAVPEPGTLLLLGLGALGVLGRARRALQ